MLTRLLLCCLLATYAVVLSAQPQSITVSGFDHPRSVWPTPGEVYVSNMGASPDPAGKDGDGYIALLNPVGRIIDQRFIKGLNAPKGMAVVRGILYVADVDHLVGFDLKTKGKVVDLSFESENTRLLTDLVIKDVQTLFVSATDIGKVYEVNLSTNTFTALPGILNRPGGLFYDASRRWLFVANSGVGKQTGDIGLFEEKGGQLSYRTLLPRVGTPDGLALLNATSLLVSGQGDLSVPGGGLVQRFDLTDSALKAYTPVASLGGSADFGLFGERLYLPQTETGTVVIQRLADN